MGYLDTMPPNYGAGTEFNYDVWTANTTITLANVPWAADYRDIAYFDTTDDLNNYLSESSGPSITYTNSTLVVPGKPIMLDIPVNQAYRYNYVHVHNPIMPGSWPHGVEDMPRDFYYFIHDVQYVAPNTTAFMVQLDVWQSFGRYVEFGPVFVERGHIGVAFKDRMFDSGRRYLSVPEGLDVGNEYTVRQSWWHEIANPRDLNLSDYSAYVVMVWSNTELESGGGSYTDAQVNMATGSLLENIPNATNIYMFDVREWLNALTYLRDKPWISQGIISVMILPGKVMVSDYWQGDVVMIGSGQATKVNVSGFGANRPTKLDGDFYDLNIQDKIAEYLPRQFRFLDKFKTSPYCVVELTTNSGTPIILKPECLPDGKLEVMQYSHYAPPNPRIMFGPYRYNADLGSNDLRDNRDLDYVVFTGGEDLDMLTGITDFPTFSVLNNGYMNYLANNRNSIAYGHESASWAQQRALAGANASYDIASNAIAGSFDSTNAAIGMVAGQTNNNAANAATQANIAMNSAYQQNVVNSTYSFVRGAVNGASGGPAGMVAGAAMGGMSAIPNTLNVGISNQAVADSANANIANSMANAGLTIGNMARQTEISAGVSAYARDTNRAYATYAANGDYQNAIGAINAKVQDAKMTQPTTSGQIGGDAFTLTSVGWYLVAKLKTPNPQAIWNIGCYWLRYGYAMNVFTRMPDDYACMSRFSYWKLRETYVKSSQCPEAFKAAIRGIFEKGVTVWRNARDIGVATIFDNQPLDDIWLRD